MKLTITEFAPYKKGAKDFVRVAFESEPVVTDSANNYFTMLQRKLVKTFELPVASVMFGKDAKAGTEVTGWCVRTKHTFTPDNSIAQEIAKGVKKVQNFNASTKTGKLYLSDGKPFFAKYELRKEGTADAQDSLFQNITAIAIPQAIIDGRRPSVDELTALGISVDQSTIDKLNAPLAKPIAPPAPAPAVAVAPAVADTARIEAANTLATA